MTLKTDTELSAVNSILGAIGQAPVTSINALNPQSAMIKQILDECILEVLNEGWHFNVELHYELTPNVNDEILISEDMLRIDIHDDHIHRSEDIVRRNGKLYDKVDHTYTFTDSIDADITWFFPFYPDPESQVTVTDYIPPVFKRYIIHKAATRAAMSMISNPQLVQLQQQQETFARASCMEYECNQGDPSFFGTPHNNSYRSYQPYHALLVR
tara:strand:- start:195 stop:833 length:639 start_codon:yes stop_codon:yes gene_type:complete